MTNIKRGQAAIEFLVTYGWAIMAAMLIIGALTYFGISNPSALPDKCIFSNSLECKDYRLTNTTLNLQLINVEGESIYGVNSAAITAKITDTGTACAVDGNPTILEPEERLNITCNTLPDAPYEIRDKVKIKITVTYAKTPSAGATYSHVSLGELYTTVQ